MASVLSLKKTNKSLDLSGLLKEMCNAFITMFQPRFVLLVTFYYNLKRAVTETVYLRCRPPVPRQLLRPISLTF